MPEDQKERVLGQIGETIAEVQRVPIGELSRIEPRWEPFMRTQIEGCGARHRRLGLPQKYWEGLDEMVHDATTLIPMNAVLHRFSDPIRHICIEGWQEKAGDLSELAELLWPV
jgi:hypothetical protein